MGKRKRSGSFSKYDDCSKKSDDGDSQEELDGESAAVHKGNIVNGIRYSARVQEKQEKLRREASPSKQTIPEATSTTIPVSCQTTVRAIIGDEPIYVYPFEPFIPHSVNTSGEKKKKRTWELWSQEDKQLFFEALNEFGKDFDSIQNYLASKLKPPRSKGSCAQAVPKNKDQVRHFYYRTWNKISKYLTFPKDMKKAYQELYGLINYGELRKKQRVLNLKTAVKLSELVERGTTTIKVRGKTFRIKTPVCRALKKLNQLDDIDHIRVPCKLCVELVPHDGNTWTSVQRVSHNPRVKVYVPLQRTLASLIIYFEERWKTDHNRLKEEFSLTMFGKPRTRLRFIPVESRDLSVPIFKFSEATSATKISLSSYVQNCLYQERKDESMLVSKKFKRKPKLESDIGFCSGNPSNRDSDYLAADADVSDADGCEATPENQFRITLRRDKFGHATGTMRPDLYMEQDNSNGFPDTDNAMWSVHEENANAATETDVGETDYGFDENMPSPTECDDNTCDEDCMDHGMQDNMMLYQLHHDSDAREDKQGTCAACKSPDAEECGGTPEKAEKQCTCILKKESQAISVVSCPALDAEAIAKGWTAEEAGALTLGEIYLTLGKCDKLCFEYMWDKCEEDKLREERARNLVGKLVSLARHLKKRKTNKAKTSSCFVSTATSTSGNPYVCTKCNGKIESPASVDGDCAISDRGIIPKDPCVSPHTGSPPRAPLPPQCETPEDNKITLHAAADVPPVEPSTEALHNDVAGPSETNQSCSTEAQEAMQPAAITKHEVEVLQDNMDDLISIPAPGLVLTDSIISTVPNIANINTPSVVSLASCMTTQGTLIDITSIASTCATNSEVDSRMRRATSNITATLLPPTPTIIRSVTLTSSSLHDIQKTTLCSTLTPVTATTTVLVSEPAIFAGITADTPSFVTIQPCSTTVSPSPSLPKTQESKFRRPADIPILMKPSNDDRSTNEDGSPKVNVPKPFLDLPKGNRRIGRRPAWKQRVIIPRMLPLLPKPSEDSLHTMATLIALPPVVAAGLSVVPVSTESLSSVTNFPICSEHDGNIITTTIAHQTAPLPSTVSITVSSIPTPSSSDKPTVTSTLVAGANLSVPGATTSMKNIGTVDSAKLSSLKSSPVKNTLDMASCSSSRAPGPFEETLDSLSLSSFMDISLPESTRFLASDLRLEELECSNNSISLSAMLDDSSRKNARDPPLLDTPKKQSGNDDSQLQIPSPQRLTPMETSWSGMNESSDLFMGGLFAGSETLRPSPNESLAEGDLNFQSVMGENSLDFESKLSEFTVHITDSNKD